ncbi:hypothetical protein N5K21_28580 [Rhizobium pusense]|uniref:hypothetical protein n=1 Tax=Agrobacterium TaxID=357 RepID=UPI000F68EA94|nr:MULTISPECIES: hypothetical protein [Agrobacterium]MDH2092657.1 hypothetical protein [Agrobacterium pusense]
MAADPEFFSFAAFSVVDLFLVRSKSSLIWSTYFFIDFSILIRQTPSEISSSSSCRLSKPERSPATTFLHTKKPYLTVQRGSSLLVSVENSNGSSAFAGESRPKKGKPAYC